MKGIFAINKPKGPSSYAIVGQIKRLVGGGRRKEKIGHAGTLDPLAEGVLVVAIGREYTKKISEVVAKEKEYLADVRLGMTSVTDDEEGEKTEVVVEKIPSLAEIEEAKKAFLGEIMQITPVYSAAKVGGGEEGYKKARRGEKFTPPPRFVYIERIDVLSYEWPNLQLKVLTGPGVYIRSLARELGEKLGTGGYLTNLVRTRVGDFRIEDAVSPEELFKTANLNSEQK
jgi:tRNA pseudouridine55 synthase